jgi:hypothetical protein
MSMVLPTVVDSSQKYRSDAEVRGDFAPTICSLGRTACTKRASGSALHQTIKASLESVGAAMIAIIFAPIIGLAWLAVWIHNSNGSGADSPPEQDATYKQAWINEMNDFDQF